MEGRKCVIAGVIYLFSFAAWASKGWPVAEDIVQDYKSSKTFYQFMGKMALHLLPGDRDFLKKLIESQKEWEADTSLPRLSQEMGIIKVGYESEFSISLKNRQSYEFEINKALVNLRPMELPSIRWKKLNGVLANEKKTVHFTFLPVVWAQASGLPTKTAVVLFAVASRQMRGVASLVNTKVSSVAFLDFLSAAQSKSRHNVSLKNPKCYPEVDCSLPFIETYGRSIVSYQPDQILCGDRSQGYEFRGAEGGKRTLNVKVDKGEVDVREVYGKKTCLYEKAPMALPLAQGAKVKGRSPAQWYENDPLEAPWRPISCTGVAGKKIEDPDAQERADQLKRLINASLAYNFCGCCSSLVEGIERGQVLRARVNPKAPARVPANQ